ncbi:hypothetical protein E2562_027286 [Oryza meyeriana var. granulata]|uniref:Uncharacterized protein n=1 Tax=Oryza meyeriana var. granulata TaxID=110450 RepID=A0A6G1C9R1_9ORYZ|nr:hypothetical protein E2562_027286 [Oryza meyeriana var. granulata]
MAHSGHLLAFTPAAASILRWLASRRLALGSIVATFVGILATLVETTRRSKPTAQPPRPRALGHRRVLLSSLLASALAPAAQPSRPPVPAPNPVVVLALALVPAAAVAVSTTASSTDEMADLRCGEPVLRLLAMVWCMLHRIADVVDREHHLTSLFAACHGLGSPPAGVPGDDGLGPRKNLQCP